MSYPTKPNGVNTRVYVDPFDWWTKEEAQQAQETSDYDALEDLENVVRARALAYFQAQEGNVVSMVGIKPEYM
jgi:hypothetical protein